MYPRGVWLERLPTTVGKRVTWLYTFDMSVAQSRNSKISRRLSSSQAGLRLNDVMLHVATTLGSTSTVTYLWSKEKYLYESIRPQTAILKKRIMDDANDSHPHTTKALEIAHSESI